MRRTKIHTMSRKLVTLLATACLAACGQNILAGSETDDPAEDATLALEDQDADGAIAILESALKNDPSNPQYLSILAAAYAQRAGVEPLRLAQRMGTTSDNTGFQIASMFSLFGDVTAQVLADIDRAVNILSVEMRFEERQPGDDFKLAIFQTSSLVLHTKALDLNGDGVISPEELLDLTDTSASGLLSQLASASSLLVNSSSASEMSQKLAEALVEFQSTIAEQAGANDSEKLRNYLATQQGL